MARKLVARAGAHREGRYAHRRFFWRGAATVPWALGLMMDSSPLIGYFCAIFLTLLVIGLAVVCCFDLTTSVETVCV